MFMAPASLMVFIHSFEFIDALFVRIVLNHIENFTKVRFIFFLFLCSHLSLDRIFVKMGNVAEIEILYFTAFLDHA